MNGAGIRLHWSGVNLAGMYRTNPRACCDEPSDSGLLESAHLASMSASCLRREKHPLGTAAINFCK